MFLEQLCNCINFSSRTLRILIACSLWTVREVGFQFTNVVTSDKTSGASTSYLSHCHSLSKRTILKQRVLHVKQDYNSLNHSDHHVYHLPSVCIWFLVIITVNSDYFTEKWQDSGLRPSFHTEKEEKVWTKDFFFGTRRWAKSRVVAILGKMCWHPKT